MPYFTLQQAEALLPEVDRAIREAIALKRVYEESEETIQSEGRRVLLSGGAMVDMNRMRAEGARRDSCAQKLKQAIEDIEAFGCEIKDLDIGLIDFRTLYHGQEVYLCWKLGEAGIEWWHGISEGFRGRKRIDEEFLRNHRGDLLA